MANVGRLVVAVVVCAGMMGLARAGAPEAGDDGAGAAPAENVASMTAENPAYARASAATRARLGKMIPCALKDKKLDEAVAELGREMGVEIVINWKALGAANVDRNSTLSLGLKDEAPAEFVLELLLREVGGGSSLGFGIDKGVLVLSTRDDLFSEKYRVTRVYDVRDLIAVSREVAAEGAAAQDRVRDLEIMIKANVYPETWADNGGTSGQLVMNEGRMVMTQTEAGHARVERLLTALRWTQAHPAAVIESKPQVRGAAGTGSDEAPISLTERDAASRKTNAAVRATLDKPITFSLEDKSLEDGVIAFARAVDMNVFVNWPALTTAGIDKNTRVTVNLRSAAPADGVLNLLLAEAGGATNPLSYAIDNGVLTISTRDELHSERYRVVRLYDVRNLVAARPGDDGVVESRFERVKELRQTLMAIVAPTSWVDNGGTIGSIMEYDGRLLINQVESNQEQMELTLAALRRGLAHAPLPAAKPQAESPEEARAKLRLSETITLFYDGRRLEDVLKDIGDKTRLDVVVDWAVLSTAGFVPDQKVTFTLKQGQPAENAISLLLESITSGKPDVLLGWQVKKGVVFVSTVERSLEVRVYDIADLIKAEQGADEERGPVVSNLMSAITGAVDPASWTVNGGVRGSVQEFRGRLIVSQSRDNLARVEQVLAGIRRTGRMPAAREGSAAGGQGPVPR